MEFPVAVLGATLLAANVVCDGRTARQEPPTTGLESALEVPREEPPGSSDPVRAAVDRGLAWLTREMALTPDGSAPVGDREHSSPIGVTALAALAFLGSGSTPARGPYQRPLDRALDYLLDHVVPEGEPHAGYVTAAEDVTSKMHGHGLAVLAMTQAYAVSPQSPLGRRLAGAIDAGVRRIELAQGPDGGWYYEPEAWDVHEGSVTVCLLWALRGARNAGFHVEPVVIQRAIAYVESLQDEDGGFLYSKQQPVTSVGLTAGALSTLHAIGIYEGNVVEDGYVYVWRNLALREEERAKGLFGSQSRFPFYERFYLAQALWHHRDPKVFRGWAEDETRRVLQAQDDDGSWTDRRFDARGNRIEGRYGDAYATAMNVLYLEVPEGLLPIFQR